MQKVKVTLEVVTPMLSFGEDQKSSEFRITELKSLMRSTFRELYYFKDSKEMKEKEGTVFGNMDRKSPIRFKIIGGEQKGTGHTFMLPHKIVMSYENENKIKARTSCLDYSRKINLYMIMNSDLNIDLYINLLIQSSIIGALGKRSRKGFGSFRVITIDELQSNEYNDILNKSPIEILKDMQVLTGKKEYKIQNFNTNILDNKSEEIEFNRNAGSNNSLDYPYVEKVRAIVIEKSEYKQIIKNISKLTHERFGVEFLKDLKEAKIKKNILGYSSGSKRFASPISVSFFENSNDKYMIIKELNYNYIFKPLKIDDDLSKKVNKEYIHKYVEELIKLGGV